MALTEESGVDLSGADLRWMDLSGIDLIFSDLSGANLSYFDYAALSDRALSEEGASKLRKLLQSQHANEPTRFGIRAGEVKTFLAERGFEILKHLCASEMKEKYLAGDKYLDIGEIPTLFCFVHARF